MFRRQPIETHDVSGGLLCESAILEKLLDKKGEIWDIVLIREGFSKNFDPVTGFPRFYSAEALKKAVQLFEGCKVFAYQFGGNFDHVPGKVREKVPEGLSLNEIGWVENVRFVPSHDGEKRGALLGKFHLVDPTLQERSLRAWQQGKKDFLGFSIDVEGKTINGIESGRPACRIIDVSKVNELTLVTNPAAGGKFQRLVASQGVIGMDISVLFDKLGEASSEVKGLKEEEKTEEKILEIFEMISFEEPAKENRDAESDELQADLKKTVQDIIAAIKAKKFDQALEMLEKLLSNYGSPMKYGYPPKYGYPYPGTKAAKTSGKESEGDINVDEEKKDTEAKGEEKKDEEKKVEEKKPEGGKAEEEVSEGKRVEKLEEELKIMKCEKVLERKLRDEAALPDALKNKIRRRFEGKAFEESELDEAIKDEKESFAALTESGQVTGLGGQQKVDVGLDQRDRMQRMLDLMVDPTVSENEKTKYEGIKGFKRLSESYNAFTGDEEVVGRIAESKMRSILEATSADYPYALGVSMNRALAKIYQRWPQNWRKIVSINNDITNFKEQQVNRWGGFSRLTAVTEDSTFPAIASPYEEKAAYTPDQFGGEFYVTRKFIKNDDLRMVRQIPQKANQAAMTTLDQFVFDLLIGYTIAGGINAALAPDGKVIYHADHKNLLTTAMGYDSIQSAINLMLEQWEYGAKDQLAEALDDSETDIDVDTGTKFKVGDYFLVDAEILGPITVIATNTLTAARGALGSTAATHLDNAVTYVLTDQLGLQPKYIVGPTDLRETMEQYTQNPEKPLTADRDMNMIKGYGIEPITIPRTRARGDANNWYLVADPMVLPAIEIGFVDGRETPELLVQDAPSVGYVFTHQRITYRILHEYGGNNIDFRPVVGAIV